MLRQLENASAGHKHMHACTYYTCMHRSKTQCLGLVKKPTDGWQMHKTCHLGNSCYGGQHNKLRLNSVYVPIHTMGLQCFDAVGWAAGRASGL